MVVYYLAINSAASRTRCLLLHKGNLRFYAPEKLSLVQYTDFVRRLLEAVVNIRKARLIVL